LSPFRRHDATRFAGAIRGAGPQNTLSGSI
jgi:hypothetical protein